MFLKIVKRIWHFFGSIKLALILIVIIAGLSLIGAFTSVNIFNSLWFATAGSLLMLNIFICSVQRWKTIWLQIRGGTIKQPYKFYTSGTGCIEFEEVLTPAGKTLEEPEKILHSRGYRTRLVTEGDKTYIAADKNRYFRVGTYFSHLSLILFVGAFIAGGYFGFRDTNFTVISGETKDVGHDTGLSLKLLSFKEEQYPNGMTKDYRSDVVLYDNGEQVTEKTIRVNHPLIYKGIRFYQMTYGLAAKNIIVEDKDGDNVFSGHIAVEGPYDYQGYQRYQGAYDLPDSEYTIRIVTPAVNSSNDPVIPQGQIVVAVTRNDEQVDLNFVEFGGTSLIADFNITYVGDVMYSGFQVSRDPTNALIWVASTLFIIGSCCVLYFPYRQVWILKQISPNSGKIKFSFKSQASRVFNNNQELNSITKITRENMLVNR
jgi:cytochrome c biogenesis protein